MRPCESYYPEVRKGEGDSFAYIWCPMNADLGMEICMFFIIDKILYLLFPEMGNLLFVMYI